MKKKFICTVMILNLIFLPCYHAYADAGTLTVAGGTVAVGGLSGAALAGLAGPAVVAVFCGMMAVGIDVELTKQSQDAGMTKTEFVKSKIAQYCQEAGKTVDVFYKGITNGTSVLKDGTLAFSDATATQIKQFINWLYESNQINEPAPSINNGKITLGGKTNTIYNSDDTVMLNNQYSLTNITASSPFIVVGYKGTTDISYSYLIVSNEPITISFKLTGYAQQSRTLSNKTKIYYYTDLGIYGNGNSLTNYGVTLYNGFDYGSSLLNSWDGTWTPEMSGTAVNDGFTGDRDEWNERRGVFDPAQGYPTVVNPGLVGQIPIPADTDITVNVRDYLDALQEVLDKLKDRVIEGVDNADGIPKDWDIPDAVEANPTIGKRPPIPDSDRTPVSKDEPIDPSNTPTLATEPLKFDLRNIFPFCIPFDIKDLIGLLEEEPEAPQYTVDWVIPFVNTHLVFTVDLEPWDDVAVICRRMELILFAFGLMLATRKLIGS